MLKFLIKVWVGGEVNDYRREYKKRKAIKKANQRKEYENKLNAIAKRNMKEKYEECYAKGGLLGLLSILILPFSAIFPPVLLLVLLMFFIGIKNLIKACIIYYKCK